MADSIISRDDAIRLGQTWYFTGKPCKHSHIEKRRVDNWACMQCERDKTARFRKQFPEEAKAQLKSWRERNAEYVQEYNKENHERWLARPGNRERHQKAARDYYDDNRERVLTYQKGLYDSGYYDEYRRENMAAIKRAFRARHKEEIAAYSREWAKNNPDKRALNERKRKSRKVINGGSHTWDDILALYEKQSGLCVGCSISIEQKFHIDHKTPISRGGSNGLRNLQLLCQPCNNQKHAKTMREWMRMKE